MLFAQMSFYKTCLSKLQEYRAPFREKPRNDSPLQKKNLNRLLKNGNDEDENTFKKR